MLAKVLVMFLFIGLSVCTTGLSLGFGAGMESTLPRRLSCTHKISLNTIYNTIFVPGLSRTICNSTNHIKFVNLFFPLGLKLVSFL
jgi:hypothetical protein